MSPEQGAQMEAMMKKQQTAMMGGQAKTMVMKSCLTKENIHQTLAYFAAKNSPGDKETSNCKITVLKSTATVIESREACSSTNEPNSNTTALYEAPNPETLTGRVESLMGGRGGLEMKMRTSGKWLGSACGNVKP
jgi:hypothetical protein